MNSRASGIYRISWRVGRAINDALQRPPSFSESVPHLARPPLQSMGTIAPHTYNSSELTFTVFCAAWLHLGGQKLNRFICRQTPLQVGLVLQQAEHQELVLHSSTFLCSASFSNQQGSDRQVRGANVRPSLAQHRGCFTESESSRVGLLSSRSSADGAWLQRRMRVNG